MSGTLYLVATPIGNLEDITLRALRTLREVAVIAAEDTRRTAMLLRRYEVRTATTSFHEHNERAKLPALVARLQAGESVALVSDAGTPSISDPGFRLVRAALAVGVRVEAIPGPSAVLTALVSSGLPTDSFVFLGFVPARTAARKRWVNLVAKEPRTCVFFESPRRLRNTLDELAKVAGARKIAVARELTKIHEELVRGPIKEVLSSLKPDLKGEVTVVVGPEVSEQSLKQGSDEEIFQEFGEITKNGGLNRREALRVLALRHGLAVRAVYQAIERRHKLG